MECSICFENFKREDINRFRRCDHVFCMSCIEQYYKNTCGSNMDLMKCRKNECKAKIYIEDLKENRYIDVNAIIQNKNEKLSRAYILCNNIAIECPNRACNSLVYPIAYFEYENQTICVACHLEVCMQHGTLWHDNMTCKEYDQLPKECKITSSDIQGDRAFEELARMRNHDIYNKNDRTFGCATHFCYICGDKYINISGVAEYGTCPNKCQIITETPGKGVPIPFFEDIASLTNPEPAPFPMFSPMHQYYDADDSWISILNL